MSAKGEAAPTNYRVYENSKIGIKIDVPSGWQYKEENTSEVLFLTNESSASGILVSVDTKSIPTNLSLDAFTQVNMNHIQQNYPNIHLITSNQTTLGGMPAHQIVFTYTSGENLNKSMEIWTLKNDKGYFIVYSAGVGEGHDNFSILLPVAKHMVGSFAITAASPPPP
jgi:hypothetical protein